MKKYFISLFVLILMLSTVIPVMANSTDNYGQFKKLENEFKRTEFLNQKINEFTEKENFKGLEKFMNQLGYYKAEFIEEDPNTDGLVSIQSSSNSVSWTFDAYRNAETSDYVMIGNWKMSQRPAVPGSPEVLSLSLWNTDYSKPSGFVWSSYPTYLTVRDQQGTTRISTRTHEQTNGNGFIWKYQDSDVCYTGCGTSKPQYTYVGMSGTAIMYAKSVPSGTKYLGGNYEHTWLSLGALRGISLGFSGGAINLKVDWDSTSSGRSQHKNQITVSSWPSRVVY